MKKGHKEPGIQECEDRKKADQLQAVKDKMDLFGPDSLTAHEQVLVLRNWRFFYPEGS